MASRALQPATTTISPSTSPSPSKRVRPSKFIEGPPLTGPDLLSRTPSTNGPLLSILSEMDAHYEKKHKPRTPSSSTNSSTNSSPISPRTSWGIDPKEKENTRLRGGSFVRRSLDVDGGRRRSGSGSGGEGLEGMGQKIKGRLRALTGQRDGVKSTPYPGT